MSDEVEGIGTELSYGTAGGSDAVAIAGLTEVSPPEEQTDDNETTHMGTADHTRTYKAGLTDPGECTFKCHFDSTQHAALAGIKRVEKVWNVTLSDGFVIAFNGYLKGLGTEVDLEGLTYSTGTVKASGAVTYTPPQA